MMTPICPRLLNLINDFVLLRFRARAPEDLSAIEVIFLFLYIIMKGTTSWLDHVLCTADAKLCTSSLEVRYDCVLSDHHPILGKIDLNIIIIIIKLYYRLAVTHMRRQI